MIKGKEIYLLIGYYSISRPVVDYFDSNHLYFITDAVLIALIGLFFYSKSDKTDRNKAALGGVLLLALAQITNSILMLIDAGFEIRHLDFILAIVFLLDAIFIVHSNYDNIKKWFLNRFKK